MMKNKSLLLICSFLILLSSCQRFKNANKQNDLISIQFLDRNGFTETISSQEKLSRYETLNFSDPQPYQKVLRVYRKNNKGQHNSILSSYHDNGCIKQWLEINEGRAKGLYKEWHPNGQCKMIANIIEGIADLNDSAQASWVFNGENLVWNQDGGLVAKIRYKNGVLDGDSFQYYHNGSVYKKTSYADNLLFGVSQCFDEQGNVIEERYFEKGLEKGRSFGYWHKNLLFFEEYYNDNGKLMNANYYDTKGNLFSSIKDGFGYKSLNQNHFIDSSVEYKNGEPKGLVKLFNEEGHLIQSYHIEDNKKKGEEIIFYEASLGGYPKISLQWEDDYIEGVVKTWYPDQILHTQREFRKNKKEGLSFAWYPDGHLMLMEEYISDRLEKGRYYKKSQKDPFSVVENGKGQATLFDEKGNVLEIIKYEKGEPYKEE
ncbi:MAG: toxin-antitoxin system YwqK family antitoxin [Rhabdochlamydiaceae bacterium]